MSSRNSVNDRHDKQLEELIKGKNWRQALSLCEKRLKKGGPIEETLVQKALILIDHPEGVRRKQGRKELSQILERHPPISELKALESLNAAARHWENPDPRIGTMWERAVTVRPGDEKIYVSWFKMNFKQRNWKAAQKAAMMYMKKFPDKREPFFWNIITCELAGTAEDSSEMDRKILRPLAYGFLSRAILEVESGNQSGVSISGRTIQTLEELLLLLRVYRSQGKYEEALAILDSPHTGITSRVGNYSWELIRQKIEIYEKCDRWKELWQFCQELLKDALPNNLRDYSRTPSHRYGAFGDDWKVWMGLLNAATKIGTDEVATLTENLIDSYVRPKSTSRNARLALLRFYTERAINWNDLSEDEYAQENLFNACFEYFSDYSTKAVCFHDLRPYVACLSRSRQQQFLRRIAQDCRRHRPKSKDPDSQVISWVTAETNALKFDYFLLASRTDIPSRLDLLKAFISNCLRLFKLSLPLGSKFPASERRPGDDAAILAVMALVHISDMGCSAKNSLLRCIVILEVLVAQSRCNYDALLLLIRLYIRTGMGSLAMHYYAQLSIKNVQNATISWILFTRISTIHPLNPYVIGNETPFDLLENLSKVLDWGLTADQLFKSSTNLMLNRGQYNMLFDTLTNPRFGPSNLPIYMVVAEFKRAARFSEIPQLKEFSMSKFEMPPHAEDVRDSTPFPDCEAQGQKRFVEYLHGAATPNYFWLATQLRQSQFWGFLRRHHDDLVHEQVDKVFRLSQKSDRDALTRCEIEFEMITENLEKLCTMALSKIHQPHLDGKAFRKIAVSLIENLEKWISAIKTARQDESDYLMDKFSADLAVPTWEYFHSAFVYLDLCRFTIATFNYLLSQEKFVALLESDFLMRQAIRVRGSVGKLCTAVRQHALERRQRLQKPGAVQKLSQVILGHQADSNDLVGKELRKLVDESWLDEIIDKLRTSWVEALSGISDIKVF